MRLHYAAATAIVFCWTALTAAPTAQTAPTAQASASYVWAAACKDCHDKQYAAWAETKHARALAHLAPAEREGGQCVGCHVTAAKALAADSANANVQCEECHGAGSAHMQGDPKAITRKPAERVCLRCHSDASPKFKYFSYAAMAPLVHSTKK
jgi:predicted CXXCH cytochrome family protein